MMKTINILTLKNAFMDKKNLLIFVLMLALSTSFTSCNEDDKSPSEDELYSYFVGSWAFSGEVISPSLTTTIEGSIDYHRDKTFKAINILYRNGELHKKERLSGICFITKYDDCYELNTSADDSNALIFSDIKFGYDGEYKKQNDNGSYHCIFSKDLNSISIYENGALTVKLILTRK